MPVLLFDSTEPLHAAWAGQWLRADPNNRRTVPMTGSGSHEQLRDVIVRAVRLAGQTAVNELVIAVGHGGSTSQAEGLVDLSPALRMRLARGTIGSRNEHGTEIFYDPFYDFVFVRPGMKSMSDKQQDELWVQRQDRDMLKGAQFRLQRDAIYRSIGDAIKASHVNQVVLLTCNIGNSIDFIKKMALDWDVKIRAYKKFIVFTTNAGKARACFEGDAAGSNSNVAAAETDVPQTDFVTVGPPLAPAATPGPPPTTQRGPRTVGGWIERDGLLLHPDAPSGPQGTGRFRLAAVDPGVNLPHPRSPAADDVDPTELFDM